VRDIQLTQMWGATPGAGPIIKPGTGFQFDIDGAGPVLGDVDLTLSSPTLPKKTVKIALMKGTNGTFPAMLQVPQTGVSFPELAKMTPGKHMVHVHVKGHGEHPTLLGEFNTHTFVVITGPPPAKGATITGLSADGVGYFTGDPAKLTVTGTPGDIGTCDSFTMQLIPVNGGAGYQTHTYGSKNFPAVLQGGADFAPLGNGVWNARLAPSGKLCDGSPGDALVQVEPPAATVKERPTLAMDKGAFVSEQAKLKIHFPAAYTSGANAGADIGCCETELYFKDKGGKWSPFNGTINRNFSDWDSEDALSYDGVLLYDELISNAAAVEWALRVRATATGRQFPWSNLARFTVK
jgi:hypothetical protein